MLTGGLSVISLHTAIQPSRYVNELCVFYDTSMKFGINVEHIMTKIFGYRAISDFALEGIGGHFPRWPQ